MGKDLKKTIIDDAKPAEVFVREEQNYVLFSCTNHQSSRIGYLIKLLQVAFLRMITVIVSVISV